MIIETTMTDCTMQIAHLENAAAGTFSSEIPFMIKNNGTEPVDLVIHPIKNDDAITTKIYPGWCPIVCDSVEVEAGQSIQIGY